MAPAIHNQASSHKKDARPPAPLLQHGVTNEKAPGCRTCFLQGEACEWQGPSHRYVVWTYRCMLDERAATEITCGLPPYILKKPLLVPAINALAKQKNCFPCVLCPTAGQYSLPLLGSTHSHCWAVLTPTAQGPNSPVKVLSPRLHPGDALARQVTKGVVATVLRAPDELSKSKSLGDFTGFS